MRHDGRRPWIKLLLSLQYRIFYFLKPFIPRALQLFLRRRLVAWKRPFCVERWPIDESVVREPLGWRGWPDGKRFALVLTHDVESIRGLRKCRDLVRLEERHGFRSSFHFVAEDYQVEDNLRAELLSRGFEIALHGLSHNCSLFRSRKHFTKQLPRINFYMKDWGCVGFRSPSTHRNLEWLREIDPLLYDGSTFDTDPFEPQPEGVRTIFPFMVSGTGAQKGYVELPYTLPQDFTLFILMQENGPDMWKQKLDWIVNHGGMALLLSHPDYMCFGGQKRHREGYPSQFYEEFLAYVKENYKGRYWHALPREVAEFYAEFASC